MGSFILLKGVESLFFFSFFFLSFFSCCVSSMMPQQSYLFTNHCYHANWVHIALSPSTGLSLAIFVCYVGFVNKFEEEEKRHILICRSERIIKDLCWIGKMCSILSKYPCSLGKMCFILSTCQPMLTWEDVFHLVKVPMLTWEDVSSCQSTGDSKLVSCPGKWQLGFKTDHLHSSVS